MLGWKFFRSNLNIFMSFETYCRFIGIRSIDRIMIAQAIVEGLSFVSKDSVLAGYSIQYVW